MKILYFSSKRSRETPLLLEIDNFEFIEINLNLRESIGMEFIKKIITLIRIKNSYKPNIILLEGAGFFSAIALFIFGYKKVPVVVRVKGNPWKVYEDIFHNISWTEKLFKYINHKSFMWIIRKSSAVLPVSDHLKFVLQGYLGDEKKFFTVNIPFSHSKHLPKSTPIVDDEEFILTVTNFNFWAKVEPLLRVVISLAPTLKAMGLSWVIIGNGFFFEKFKFLVKQNTDFDTIKIKGKQNPLPFYKKAKALFYISGLDGLPNVILEAWEQRTPVIINHDCPAVEFIKDGFNGLVVDFSDKNHVNEILNMLKSKNEYFTRITEIAYQHVCSEFSVEKVSQDLKNALIHCLERNKLTTI